MADNNGERVTHGSVGTTAETSYLTKAVNRVGVQNKHATQTLGVRVFTASTAAALADATDAVEGADEVRYIPAATKEPVTVFQSSRAMFVALSVIGSGATTTYEVSGHTYLNE
jgi:hypothetical protein